MLKSSEYRQKLLEAFPDRIDEVALTQFLVPIDAWAEHDKTVAPTVGTESDKINFVKLVIALGDDDLLIDTKEAKILARALPRACYKPTSLSTAGKKLKNLATSAAATYFYTALITAVICVVLAYFAGMFAGAAQEKAQHLNRDLLTVEEANSQLHDMSARLTEAENKLQKATEDNAATKEGLNKTIAQAQQKIDELNAYATRAHKYNETLLDALTSYRNAAQADDAKERTRLRNEGDEKRLKLNELKP